MKSKIFKLIFLFLVVFSVFTGGDFTLAQDIGTDYAADIGLQGAGGTDIRVFLVNIVRFFLAFVGLIAVVMMIYGGFLWMTSAGSSDRVERAKKTIISATIGLIITLSAFAIVTFVINITGDSLSESCTPLVDSRNCGCADAGIQTCQADGTWGACAGDCLALEVCCSDAGVEYCSDDCSIPPTFNIVSSYPADGDSEVIRNAKIRFTFDRKVGASVDNTNFIVTDSSGVEVPGTRIVDGKRIEFIPDGSCGVTACDAANCFVAGETINVQVVNGAAGVLSVGGIELTCGGFTPCDISFDIGTLIDCDDPVVNLDFGQVCVSASNELYANASDDSGIDKMEFFIDGASLLDASNPVVNGAGDSPFNTFSEVLPVFWDASGYTPGDTVNIKVTAFDIDSHDSSDSRNFSLRPDHCCNGLLDDADGETGVDCGGACAACDGAACGVSLNDDCVDDAGIDCSVNNGMCSSGLCGCGGGDLATCASAGYGSGVDDCCLCQSRPVIDWITPAGGFCYDDFNLSCQDDDVCSSADGVCDDLLTFCTNDSDCISGQCNIGCSTEIANAKPGNLVTIGGRYFGDYVAGSSLVEFETGSGFVAANLASTVNANCTESWTDRRVVVVVPAGALAVNPAIRITSGSGYSDDSTDNYGSFIDFVSNTIDRPGLCGISPDSGVMNDVITYEGINLTGSKAFFGNQFSNVVAVNPDLTGPTSGNAQVPNLRVGKTSTFASKAGVISNFLDFTKLSEPTIGARIISFSPTSGTVGQYVTIYGNGFGSSRGPSKVLFDADGDLSTNADQAEADYTFPPICADSLWKDSQVIVKIPTTMPSDGGYFIFIDLGDEVIDTKDLTIDQFDFDSALSLFPSLCKIDPVMGPNNSPIALYGEYFGNVSDSVWFHLNHEQTGAAILSWTSEEIKTTIHPLAVSGPVSVEKGGNKGNSLNLEVGMCTEADDPTSACGGDFCCPAGTSEEGRCHASEDDCYSDIPSSVYEWDFSTDAGTGIGAPCYDGATAGSCDVDMSECDPGLLCDSVSCTCQAEVDEFDSCNNRSKKVGSCDPLPCPNSPGTCSPYDASGDLFNTGTACSDDACAPYSYNADLNRCTDNNSCSLASTTLTLDILGRPITAYCANDGGASHWFIDTNLSCPSSDWQKLLTQCVLRDGSTCDLCASGFDCRNDNDGDVDGLCAIGDKVCSPGSYCDSGECVKEVENSCQCCCEIGQDARDCCAPLTCEGTCGNDTTDDASGFGMCTGCADVGVTQADHNEACNCSGTGGKYCDTSAAGGRGVCTDCALLSSPEECSANADVCCVDAANNDNCRGGEGTLDNGFDVNVDGYFMQSNGGDPAYAYCSYYECNSSLDTCSVDFSTPTAVASSTVASSSLFMDSATCVSECKISSNQNESCDTDPDPDVAVCDLTICKSAYSCFDEDLTSCGNCCCDMNNDLCSSISPSMFCAYSDDSSDSCYDSVQDDGNDFGICCGCTDDASCGAPDATGCGNDTCCHPRPDVIANVPSDMGPPEDISGAVCRNAMISATFSEKMDIDRYTGNIIVVGDYGNKVCPEGTQYLAAGNKKIKQNIFVRIFNSIKSIAKRIARFILPTHFAKAYLGPDNDHNYCAITGAVKGYNRTDEGVMEFLPLKLLDGDRWYYVIVKGDENLDGNSGVASSYGIGMNGSFDASFNGITYSNSHVWSFKTLPEEAANNGICDIDRVDIYPSSYLFQTAENEQAENDTDPTSDSFDKYKDGDKMFIAQPKSVTGQLLSSVEGYAWTWSWTVSNSSVADIDTVPFSTDADRQLLRAKPKVVDGRTFLTATTVLDGGNTYSGPPGSGSAKINVFICENPWPPVADDGTWSPWQDVSDNCTVLEGGCTNTNYEIYYCRDDGRVGTYDDLPAILSDKAVIRGTTLSCSDGSGACPVGLGVFDSCGASGVCEPDILKEAFFLREESLTSTTSLTVVNNGLGDIIDVNWKILLDPDVDAYKLYWGTKSQTYFDYAEVTKTGVSDKSEVVCSVLLGEMKCMVTGLVNNKEYYFNLTGYNKDASVETDFYGEASAIPSDTIPPSMPLGFSAVPADGEVYLSWDEVVGADSYKVYYGNVINVYGSAQNIGDEKEIIISGLLNDKTYWFTVSALDEAGNESSKAPAQSATPTETAVGFTADGDLMLVWNTGGTGSYEIYYEIIE